MKNRSKDILKQLFGISLVFLCCVLPLHSIAQDESGGQPGAFLRLGVGVRALGMGGTFTAVANDVSTAYWNPAGLSTLTLTEILGTYSILSMDRTHNYVSFAVPLGSAGTIGASWINLSVNDIEGRDRFGRTTETFSNAENAFMLSYGYAISEQLSVGGTVKYLSHSLERYNSTGFGFDAGILVKLSDSFRIGASIQDIYSRVMWDTGSSLSETFPITARVGAAVVPFNLPVIVGFDYEQVQDQASRLHAGVEVAIKYGTGLRLGFDDGQIAAGAFLNVPLGPNSFQVDYSFGQDPIDRTFGHRASLLIRFSKFEFRSDEADRRTTRRRPSDRIDLLYPPPDGRIIKITEDYPNYGLVNIGSDQGVVDGLVLSVFRMVSRGEGSQSEELIGTVRVVKVDQNVSAVRVRWLREGYVLEEGDVLRYTREDEE